MEGRPAWRRVIREAAVPRAGLDITQCFRQLAGAVVDRTPALAHVNLDAVAIGFVQARKPVLHGIQATLTPLRFVDGSLVQRRRGRDWTIQRLFTAEGREFLYLLRFYLPRFLDQPLGEKLTTVFHELWHISPAFDGDLRRHPGRCFAHSPSQRQYDDTMRGLVEDWLRTGPPPDCYEFLHLDFGELRRRHGAVYGLRIPPPRLIPLAPGEAESLLPPPAAAPATASIAGIPPGNGARR